MTAQALWCGGCSCTHVVKSAWWSIAQHLHALAKISTPSAAQSARARLEEEQQRAERASPAEAALQERQQAQRASERGAEYDVLAAEVAVAEAEERLLSAKLARLRLSSDARKVMPAGILSISHALWHP